MTYGSDNSIGWVIHILNPALVSNGLVGGVSKLEQSP